MPSTASTEHETATLAYEFRGTVTVFRDRGVFGRPVEPVRGLRVLPDGPLFYLDDYQYENAPKRGVVVGSGPHCDIVLCDAGVSGNQCILYRDKPPLLVRDCGSRNGSAVNGVRAEKAELPVGGLLTVGFTTLVAFGEKGADQELWIGASSLREFIMNAEMLYGSKRQAAVALGVPESTLRGWLKDKKFQKVNIERSYR